MLHLACKGLLMIGRIFFSKPLTSPSTVYLIQDADGLSAGSRPSGMRKTCFSTFKQSISDALLLVPTKVSSVRNLAQPQIAISVYTMCHISPEYVPQAPHLTDGVAHC